ncbi:hypothetical protein [Oceanobacillus sp. CF4.6]|uniref:hypothetical protein n=1 Tax=Oceanobacillus sp. CF4.6 TaxID=3373080 RepID=UPI003EE47F74
MVIAFQIILFIVILVSLFMVIGAADDLKLRSHATGICMAAMASFIVSAVVL